MEEVPKKKVLFVVPNLVLAETVSRLGTLIHALMAQETDAEVILYDRTQPELHLPILEHITCHYLKGADEFLRMKNLRHKVQDAKPDVLVSFGAVLNMRVILSVFRLGVPYIVYDALYPQRGWVNQIRNAPRHILYMLADKIIVPTKEAKQDYPFWLQYKIVVIPNSVVPTEQPFARDNKVIVAASRLSSDKNLVVLLDAFARIKERHPDWSLQIWGQGPARADLERHASVLKLNSTAIFKGGSVLSNKWLDQGCVFVTCARSEIFPNALADAMEAGYAVIATPFSYGAREMIQNGVDGLLCYEPTRSALMNVLQQVVSDQNRLSMGRHAREKAQNQWSVASVTAQWQDIFESL